MREERREAGLGKEESEKQLTSDDGVEWVGRKSKEYK